MPVYVKKLPIERNIHGEFLLIKRETMDKAVKPARNSSIDHVTCSLSPGFLILSRKSKTGPKDTALVS